MGLNAFFAYTVVLVMGYSWQQALAGTFISGILFIILSLTGLREFIINSIPKSLKHAVGTGIGFFIAFLGFQNAGIIVNNESTLVGLGDFKDSLLYAAKLAAYFSKGRNHPQLPVDYTRRKYVKKSANAPAGLVTYTNFKTLIIGLTPEDVARIIREGGGGK